jgi:hypothetical protein
VLSELDISLFQGKVYRDLISVGYSPVLYLMEATKMMKKLSSLLKRSPRTGVLSLNGA